MKCAREKIMEFLDGELQTQEMEEVESHLKQCSSCTQYASETSQTIQMIQSLPRGKAPTELREKVRQNLNHSGSNTTISAHKKAQTEKIPPNYPKIFSFRRLSTVAAVIFIFLSGWFFAKLSNSPFSPHSEYTLSKAGKKSKKNVSPFFENKAPQKYRQREEFMSRTRQDETKKRDSKEDGLKKTSSHIANKAQNEKNLPSSKTPSKADKNKIRKPRKSSFARRTKKKTKHINKKLTKDTKRAQPLRRHLPLSPRAYNNSAGVDLDHSQGEIKGANPTNGYPLLGGKGGKKTSIKRPLEDRGRRGVTGQKGSLRLAFVKKNNRWEASLKPTSSEILLLSKNLEKARGDLLTNLPKGAVLQTIRFGLNESEILKTQFQLKKQKWPFQCILIEVKIPQVQLQAYLLKIGKIPSLRYFPGTSPRREFLREKQNLSTIVTVAKKKETTTPEKTAKPSKKQRAKAMASTLKIWIYSAK